jgi:GDPmannose 4,6-dehydratase
MFGNSCDSDGYHRETTHMSPVSPYGCAKLYAHNLCHNYRNAYGMFICSGILFNHESPRRGINFVTNKVALQAAKIKLGMANELVLGNLRAKRDWGHARDYVRGMWNMLQMPKADDYVLATGYAYSVEDMVEFVFEHLGMDYRKYVKTDKKYERPEELHYLRGDASKAKREMGWEPTTSFEEMMGEMADYWMHKLQNPKLEFNTI